MLQFMGSQRVGHDWATELNWTELNRTLFIVEPVHNVCSAGFHKYYNPVTVQSYFFLSDKKNLLQIDVPSLFHHWLLGMCMSFSLLFDCFFKLRATAIKPVVEITSQNTGILEFELDTVTEWIVRLFPVGMVDVLKNKTCKNRNKVVFGNKNINKINVWQIIWHLTLTSPFALQLRIDMWQAWPMK